MFLDGKEPELTIELEDEKYRKFIFKMFQEDQNMTSLRLAEENDLINLTLYDNENDQLVFAQLDPNQKILFCSDYKEDVYERFMNDELTLLSTQIERDRLFEEIEKQVNILEYEFGVTTESSPLVDFNETFNQDDFSLHNPRKNLKILLNEYEKTTEALNHIENLLKRTNEYLKTYSPNKEEYLNIHGQNFEQDSKVAIYEESFNDIKNLQENKRSFLEFSIKYETEKFLREINPSIFNKLDINPKDTRLAEMIVKSDPRQLNTRILLNQAIQSIQNNQFDKLIDYQEAVLLAEYHDIFMKKQALYTGKSYEGTKLETYILNFKKDFVEQLVRKTEQIFQATYGKDFKLFKPHELEDAYRVVKKLQPVIQSKNFNIYMLHRFEAVTKEDFKVKQFWEEKNRELLRPFIQRMGDTEKFYVPTFQELDELRERIFDNKENFHDISNKALKNIYKQLEEKIQNMKLIHLEVRKELSTIRSQYFEKGVEMPTEVYQKNHRLNDVSQLINRTTKELETMKEFVELQIDEKQIENIQEKEEELEL